MPDNTSPEAPKPVVLLNRRQQPVEIHLGADVRVLPPGGRTEIKAAHMSLPQVQRLIASKALSVAVPSQAAPRAAAAPDEARTDTAGKPSKQKRAKHGASTSAATPTSLRPSSKGESA